jgi:hypothetical protein
VVTEFTTSVLLLTVNIFDELKTEDEVEEWQRKNEKCMMTVTSLSIGFFTLAWHITVNTKKQCENIDRADCEGGSYGVRKSHFFARYDIRNVTNFWHENS